MLRHLRFNIPVGIVHTVQIEVCPPYRRGTVQCRRDSIVERGIQLGVWRRGTTPSAGQFPDNCLGCRMTAQLLIAQCLRIFFACNLSLPVHQGNSNGQYLFPAEPIHSAAAILHFVYCIRSSAVSPLVSKLHSGLDAIGNIVVIRIARLIFQIHRVQRKDLLVLDISLCRNVNTSAWQRQVSKSIGCSRNFSTRIERKIIVQETIILRETRFILLGRSRFFRFRDYFFAFFDFFRCSFFNRSCSFRKCCREQPNQQKQYQKKCETSFQHKYQSTVLS